MKMCATCSSVLRSSGRFALATRVSWQAHVTHLWDSGPVAVQVTQRVHGVLFHGVALAHPGCVRHAWPMAKPSQTALWRASCLTGGWARQRRDTEAAGLHAHDPAVQWPLFRLCISPLHMPRQCVQGLSTKEHQWKVLLDAAAFVPTQPLDLEQFPADFVTISFYKMFGYPTGLGALLVCSHLHASMLPCTPAPLSVSFQNARQSRCICPAH